MWRPFDLHPEYPPEGIPFAALEARYGDGDGVAERHRTMFDQAGLPYGGKPEKIPNSRRALMLGELARERGAFAELHPRLFDAYWARGLDIGDERVLVDEGIAVGLDQDEVRETFREERYLDQVEAYTRAAIELGAGGVPAWLIDERFLVPGAQPHDVFEQVLGRLGHEPVD